MVVFSGSIEILRGNHRQLVGDSLANPTDDFNLRIIFERVKLLLALL